MFRRLLLALSVVFALPQVAAANGRPPGTSSIHFQPGNESHIAAGMTFGLLLSDDGGATWRWICEDAINYTGMYDPDYSFTPDGSLFATTFGGLQVSRDGCTFTQLAGSKFFSSVTTAVDSKGQVFAFAAAADGKSPTSAGDSAIYRSLDGGKTFPMKATPGIVDDWWASLEAAPSDPKRVYLSGYRFEPATPPNTGKVKKFLFFRSVTTGEVWEEVPLTGIETMPNSTIEIAGISHENPDLVFARVKLSDNSISDKLYRFERGTGDLKDSKWIPILEKAGAISFLVRRGTGDLVAATQSLGTVVSTNDGVSWTDLVNPPHINCLAENAAGEVWACTQNFGTMGSPPDNYGIMKSRDLATWQPVLRFQDIKEPVACADGTTQKDRCDAELWCATCDQVGCDPQRVECIKPDPNAGDGGGSDGAGCCQGAPPAPGALLMVFGVGLLLLRPRRR